MGTHKNCHRRAPHPAFGHPHPVGEGFLDTPPLQLPSLPDLSSTAPTWRNRIHSRPINYSGFQPIDTAPLFFLDLLIELTNQ